MAWVLPSSLLFTEYGKRIQNILKDKFTQVEIIEIEERFFIDEGTDEKTLFLLCEGYQEGIGEINNRFYSRLDDALKYVVDINNIKPKIEKIEDRGLDFDFSSLDLYRLSDISDIKIGIVIGASKYLLFTKSQINEFGLDKSAYYPIFCKASHVDGLQISRDNLKDVGENAKTYLINFESLWQKNLEKFNEVYDTIPKDIFINNVTFSNRQNWYGYNDHKTPDAFLVYFNRRGPRIILNSDELNSTNSIHRLYFKNEYNDITFKKMAAISAITSYTLFHAETIGRRYGAGILKLEPSDAKKLLYCFPKQYNSTELENTFNRIDLLLKQHSFYQATELADNFIFSNINVENVLSIRSRIMCFNNIK